MRLYNVTNGARFFWPGNRTQAGSYCLKCTWLVVYHMTSGRFAMLWPWTAVRDVEEEHTDELPSDGRIQRAHQQAMGLLMFGVILLIAIVAVATLRV